MHADAEAGQFARHRQGHADHAALRRGVRGLADLPFVGGDRGGVDDDAAFAVGARVVALHLLGAGLGHVEAADQVDHHRGLELRELHRAVAAQHAAGTEDAGAVHRHVQAAEEVLRCGDIGDDAGFVGDIGAEIACVGLAESGDGGRALVVVDVEQGDLAAMGDQVLRHREAEAGDATGDHGAGIGKLHAGFLRAENLDFTGVR